MAVAKTLPPLCGLLLFCNLAVSGDPPQSFAQRRTAFCKDEFDFFVTELTKVQPKHPVLFTLTNAWKIHRYEDKYCVYHLEFFTNSTGPYYTSKAKRKPEKEPYVRLHFGLQVLRPESTIGTDKSSIFLGSLEGEFEDRPRNEVMMSHLLSRSGILISTGIESDNQALRQEIKSIFRALMDHIIKWQNKELAGKRATVFVDNLGLKCELDIFKTSDEGASGVLISIQHLPPDSIHHPSRENLLKFPTDEEVFKHFEISLFDVEDQMKSIAKFPGESAPEQKNSANNPKLKIEKLSSHQWVLPLSQFVSPDYFSRPARITALMKVNFSLGDEIVRFPDVYVTLTAKSIKETPHLPRKI